ncbi:MAG: oxidoreductase [uncultured Pseudonocardia sp.]|uniref:Oxidoreductase n=1 Tax=uncultured Pseudonocardia sp. TaxID=211455 RepID=A0A6J4PCI1_9PSEU|nr:MAG: oxidoreductase [uncultured Pseudonocardia sp.]
MKFGLFGTGWWARDTQGPGLVAAPDAELVGVWGRNPEKAAALADRLGTEPWDDADALVEASEAVSIALPPDVQAPLAARAAERGRHLLLDKPLALDVAAADAVAAAVRGSGVTAGVFFTGRYQPAVERALQDIVDRGSWDGGRATVLVSVLRPGGVLLESTWRVEHGALWDAAPHAVSPLITVLGPVVEVVAVEGRRRTVHLTLRHHDGAVSTITTSLEAAEAAGRWTVEFFGEPGWADLPGWERPGYEAFALAVTDLVEAVGQGREPRCGLGYAADVLAVQAAGARSLAEGRPVSVTPSS